MYTTEKVIKLIRVTGRRGRLVISGLQESVPAGRILTLVGNPEREHNRTAWENTVRYAEDDDPATLDSALARIECLLILSPMVNLSLYGQ